MVFKKKDQAEINEQKDIFVQAICVQGKVGTENIGRIRNPVQEDRDVSILKRAELDFIIFEEWGYYGNICMLNRAFGSI